MDLNSPSGLISIGLFTGCVLIEESLRGRHRTFQQEVPPANTDEFGLELPKSLCVDR